MLLQCHKVVTSETMLTVRSGRKRSVK